MLSPACSFWFCWSTASLIFSPASSIASSASSLAWSSAGVLPCCWPSEEDSPDWPPCWPPCWSEEGSPDSEEPPCWPPCWSEEGSPDSPDSPGCAEEDSPDSPACCCCSSICCWSSSAICSNWSAKSFNASPSSSPSGIWDSFKASLISSAIWLSLSTSSWPFKFWSSLLSSSKASWIFLLSPSLMASPSFFKASSSLFSKASPISSLEFALSTASSTLSFASSILSWRLSVSTSSFKSLSRSLRMSSNSSWREESILLFSSMDSWILSMSSDVLSFHSSGSGRWVLSWIASLIWVVKQEAVKKPPARIKAGMFQTESLSGRAFGLFFSSSCWASSLCFSMIKPSLSWYSTMVRYFSFPWKAASIRAAIFLSLGFANL